MEMLTSGHYQKMTLEIYISLNANTENNRALLRRKRCYGDKSWLWKQLANYAVENLQVEDSQLEFEASLHPYNHTNEYLLVYTPAKTLP